MVQRTIAVGVGGASGLRALAWAAQEADRTQDRLVLLRVCPSCSPLARFVGEPPLHLLEQADRGLVQAVAETGVRRDGQRQLRIMVGDPGTALAEASLHADLMVISATNGDVATRIMPDLHCPLVVVHPGPDASGDPFTGHVLVGVDGSEAGRVALDFAFAYAAAHGLPVVAAHVSAGSSRDYFAGDPTADPAALELVSTEIAPWELRYPHVLVRWAILRGDPADRLIRAAKGVPLLVIGSDDAAGHTGRLPRAVAARAQCPVSVVPFAHAGVG